MSINAAATLSRAALAARLSETKALFAAATQSISASAAQLEAARARLSAVDAHADAPRFEVAKNYERAALRCGWWSNETHTNGLDLWLNAIDACETRRRDEHGELVFSMSLVEAACLLSEASKISGWSTGPACPLIVTRIDTGEAIEAAPAALATVEAAWAPEGSAQEIQPPCTLCGEVEPPIYEHGARALVSFRARVGGELLPVFACAAADPVALFEQRRALDEAGLLPFDAPEVERMAGAMERAGRLEVAFYDLLAEDACDLDDLL